MVVCRSAAAIARVTLSVSAVYHPTGSISVNCCLAGSARSHCSRGNLRVGGVSPDGVYIGKLLFA